MSTLEMARAERRDLADFCSGLSPADWDAPSLCVGWRVRDVVAHILSYEGSGPTGFASRLVRGGLNPHRANREAAAGFAERDRRNWSSCCAVPRSQGGCSRPSADGSCSPTR